MSNKGRWFCGRVVIVMKYSRPMYVMDGQEIIRKMYNSPNRITGVSINWPIDGIYDVAYYGGCGQ